MAYPYTRITNPYQNLQSTAEKKVEVIELPKNNASVSVVGQTTKNPVVAPTAQQKTAAATTIPRTGEVTNISKQVSALNTSGLNEAYTRMQKGTANEIDKANINYAKSKGWSPTTPTAPSVTLNDQAGASEDINQSGSAAKTEPTAPKLSSMYTPEQPEEIKTLTSKLADIQSKINAKQTAIEQGDIDLTGGELALEGQGRGIPLTLIRGQQGKLELQRQIAKQTEQTELAGLQREEAGLISRLTNAQSAYKAEQEKYAPTTVKNQIIQYNPTTGKYETLYEAPEDVETVAVGAGQAIVNKKTGEVIYKGEAEDELLSPTEANQLNVPYGTTKSQAAQMGIVPKSASEVANTSGLTPQQTSTFLGITNKYQSDALVQAYDKGQGLEAIADQVIANPGNAANQLKSLYVLVKNLDPDSAVREGEVALANKTQSYIDTFNTALTRVYKGQVISPETAKSLAVATKELVSAWETAKNAREARYRSQAQVAGVGNAFEEYIGGTGVTEDDPLGLGFNAVGSDTNKAAMRTDRHNNPTAFTTDIAKLAGLKEGVDYTKGDPFSGGKYYTAKLLGDPIATTIKVIDNIGFYTPSGGRRWTHTAIAKSTWDNMNYNEKKNIIQQMYQREGGKTLASLFTNNIA